MEAEAQDLQGLEGKVFQQYNSDGAFETLLGLGLLVGGLILSHILRSPFGGVLAVFLVMLGRAWKKKITYPRLGYVEHSKFRQKQRSLQKLFIFSVLAAVLVFVVALLMNQHEGAADPWQRYARLFFTGVIAIIVVGISLFRARQAPVLYVFVAVIAAFVLLVYTNIMNPATMLLLSGGGFAIYGLIKLVRFVRTNPRLAGDAAHDDLR